MTVKQERRDRSKSPLIQVKTEECYSPKSERAHYAAAEAGETSSEEVETSELGETTSEEGGDRKWRRRQEIQERRPKSRRKYDAECPCPKGEPKAMGLKHVPKHPNPVPGPKAGPWRTNPRTWTPPPREARAPASPPPSPPTGQPTQAQTATAALANPHVEWLSGDANEPWWNETRDAWWAELREEVRSHAKSLTCTHILGYSET